MRGLPVCLCCVIHCRTYTLCMPQVCSVFDDDFEEALDVYVQDADMEAVISVLTNLLEVTSLLAAAVQQQCFSQKSGRSGMLFFCFCYCFLKKKYKK